MNKRKYNFFPILILILCIIFSSCETKPYDVENQNKKNVYDTYENWNLEIGNHHKIKDKKNSIIKFLKKNKFTVKALKDNIILCSFDNDITYDKDKKPITLLVTYDKTNSKYDSQVYSIALSILKNKKNTRNSRILFIPRCDNENTYKQSLKKLPKKYIKNSDFISLLWKKQTSVHFQGIESFGFDMTKTINYIKPKGSQAFKISINNLDSKEPQSFDKKHLNPIVYISSILVSLKSSGYPIELASMNSNLSNSSFPKEASAVFVVEDDFVDKIEAKLESSKENFRDQVRQKNPDATFDFSKESMPKHAIDYNTSSDILSLIYILKDQILATSLPDNEGEPIATSTITSIHLSKEAVLKGLFRSSDPTTSSIIKSNLKKSAFLSNFSMKSHRRFYGWSIFEDYKLIPSEINIDNAMPEEVTLPDINQFTKDLSNSLDKHDVDIETKTSFNENVMSPMTKLIDHDANILSIGVNLDDSLEIVDSIVEVINN